MAEEVKIVNDSNKVFKRGLKIRMPIYLLNRSPWKLLFVLEKSLKSPRKLFVRSFTNHGIGIAIVWKNTDWRSPTIA